MQEKGRKQLNVSFQDVQKNAHIDYSDLSMFLWDWSVQQFL